MAGLQMTTVRDSKTVGAGHPDSVALSALAAFLHRYLGLEDSALAKFFPALRASRTTN
jgi:hypothetical protein